ncbi:MAG: hypothetical protein LBN74_08565 [Prevotella sp.]|jgi:hypothetical protein|nr:hypothetical protein [Prevotella sp.]
MKNFKLITLIILTFSFASQVSGQSRNVKIDDNSLIIQTQSEKLREATGWKLDVLGNWISNQNAISGTKLDESTRYSVPQSFKWLQLISLRNGGQDIYALLYETAVRLSNAQNENRIYYFLMTNKSYSDIAAAIAAKTGETLTIHSSSFGFMSNSDGIYSVSKLLQLMKQSIQTNENALKYDFSINAQHVDNEDVVRFILPEKANESNDPLIAGYFEIKWNDFKRILLPASNEFQNKEFDLGEKETPVAAKQQIDNGILPNTEPKASDSGQPISPVSVNASQDDSQAQNTDGLFDRQIRERAFVSAPIAAFSGIEGWYKNSAGDWVKDSDPTYRFETVGRYEMRNFKYHDKDYILITRFEKYTGESFYLIAKEDYLDTFANLDNSSILRFPLVSYAILSHKLEDMIKSSEEVIDTPKRADAIIFKTNYLILQYKLSSTKDISRFFIFQQECSKYGSETSKENCTPKISAKIKYDDEALLGSEVLFNKMYYESTYNNFMDFFQKPLVVPGIKSNRSNDGLAPR